MYMHYINVYNIFFGYMFIFYHRYIISLTITDNRDLMHLIENTSIIYKLLTRGHRSKYDRNVFLYFDVFIHCMNNILGVHYTYNKFYNINTLNKLYMIYITYGQY